MNTRTVKKNGIYLPRLGIKQRKVCLAGNAVNLNKKKYNKVIVMTLCNRPDYTNQVLRSFEKCTGIEDYHMIMCVEPINGEVIKLAKTFNACSAEVIVNSKRLGCNQNTFQALDRGFSLCDYVIAAEDDTVFARDALRYFEYCRLRFEQDKDVFSICSYSREKCSEEKWFEVKKIKLFYPWGWATWRSRWLDFKDTLANPVNVWDTNVLLTRHERSIVVPSLSRVQNIGALNGAHVPSAEWHHKYHHIEMWSDSVNLPVGKSSFKFIETS